MVPADQGLGLASQPLLARVSFDLGLVTQHDFAVLDGAFELPPRDTQHATPAAAGRCAEVIEVKILADPLDILVGGQLVDELGILDLAQRAAVCCDDDAERCPVPGPLERTDRLRTHVVLGQEHDATALPVHELRERRRAGKETQGKAHLAHNVVERAVGANSFTCNQKHDGRNYGDSRPYLYRAKADSNVRRVALGEIRRNPIKSREKGA